MKYAVELLVIYTRCLFNVFWLQDVSLVKCIEQTKLTTQIKLFFFGQMDGLKCGAD